MILVRRKKRGDATIESVKVAGVEGEHGDRDMLVENLTNEREISYTFAQMGHACEMLVAANLTLAGVPAFIAPKNWPDYDIIGEHPQRGPVRISVKSSHFRRTHSKFIKYRIEDRFDWLAVVLIYSGGARHFYVLPRGIADEIARTDGENAKTKEKYWPLATIEATLDPWKDNFRLDYRA